MSIVEGHTRARKARLTAPHEAPLPPVASARQLTDLWAARDAQYARRKIHGVRSPLTEQEQAAVISWRRGECEGLPRLDRSVALSILSRWAPPRVMA